ncbi:MAG: Sir2 family NAD-dependent protein deacetylase [Corynebacterium sp.]|nr:Sir2 family NAD-dependent protein deacetylase [Corynebacterium sp.]
MVDTMPFDDAAVQLAHKSALRSIARVVEETTTSTPAQQAVEEIRQQLELGPAAVLTGAGVSTDSGIPDYRGPRGSLSRHRPMTYQEFLYDDAAVHRYWARSFVGWRIMNTARPNSTHFALVELERAGYVNGIITQNVDGLHTQAGSRNVISLHGNLDHVVCLECGQLEARTAFDVRLAEANPGYLESIRVESSMVNPDGDVTLDEAQVARFHLVKCTACSSPKLKPDVVYFGEDVPAVRKQAAYQLLADASSLLVAGSSLAVMSGMRFVLEALKQGKPVAVINGGPGRADSRVTTLWRTPVAPAFSELLDVLGLS